MSQFFRWCCIRVVHSSYVFLALSHRCSLFISIILRSSIHKMIPWYRVHTLVSRPSPNHLLMIHISDLWMITWNSTIFSLVVFCSRALHADELEQIWCHRYVNRSGRCIYTTQIRAKKCYVIFSSNIATIFLCNIRHLLHFYGWQKDMYSI